MRKAQILLILGVWVTILPYLGFPYSWKDVLFTLSGLALVYLGYLLYKDSKKEIKKNIFDNFSENSDFDEVIIETTTTETTEPVKLDQI